MSTRRWSILASLVLAWAGVAAGDDFEQLAAWKDGQSRAPLAAIEATVRGANPEKLALIEGKCLAVLANANATLEARSFACKILWQIGTDRSVPALAKLLTDEKLSHMARFALEGMAGEKAGEALRGALGKTSGVLRIGVIGSIGARRDAKAVPVLAALLKDTDAATIEVLMKALGKIGTAEALAALEAARPPVALAAVKADSVLLAADAMAARGEGEAAAKVYKKMMAAGEPALVRAAAVRGLARAGAVEAVVELLKANDPASVQMIGTLLAETPGPEATAAFAGALAGLPAPAQAAMIAGLAARGDKSAAPAVVKAAGAGDAAVRLAAARALGTLGDAASVPPLAEMAGQEGDVAQAAAESLTRVSGPGVAEALAKAAGEGKTPARVKVIGALGARGDRGGAPALIGMARDNDAAIRVAACKALGELGAPEAVPVLVERVTAAEGDGERAQAGKALAMAAKGIADPSARTAPIVAAMAKASEPARCELVAVLGRLGGAEALAAVRGQLAGPAGVHKAALRTLADWPDAGALEDVAKLARTEGEKANRTLALRGYIRLAALAGKPAPETVAMLDEAMKLARGPEEKKAVLAVLPKFACPEAIQLAEAAAGDPTVAAEAKVALQKIKNPEKPRKRK